MRILIYGFGPYRQFRDNITEKIVRALPRRRGLKTIIFPVRFHKRQFTAALKDFAPDVVLGLGQCSRGRLLRQERRAVNRRRDANNKRPAPIVSSGSARLFADLKLDLGAHAKSSQAAGTYVCNFSMYVMLDHIKRRKLPVRYGFVHVPRGYDVKGALRVLQRAISTLGKGNRH
jgi:pyroglutamyl-peptidase